MCQVFRGCINCVVSGPIPTPSHDAYFFPGETKAIAANNWDGAAGHAMENQKLDKAIRFKLTPQAKGKMECYKNGGRDVCVYKGKEGINLRDPNVVDKWAVFDRTKQGKK